MTDDSKNTKGPVPDDASLPPAVDRDTFTAQLDELRIGEKAHTRAGDEIAAARWRLPMVEMTPPRTRRCRRTGYVARRVRGTPSARRVLPHVARRASRRRACEGCTWNNTQVTERSYLYSRDITYAVLCQGPYDESSRYRDFMGWDLPWYSARPSLDALLVGRVLNRMRVVCYVRAGDRVFETYWTTGRGVEEVDYNYSLMDLTVWGRQEEWRTRPTAVRSSAPTPAPGPARQRGPQSRPGRAGAPSPTGRASRPAVPTTSPSTPPLGQPRLSDDPCGRARTPQRSAEHHPRSAPRSRAP